MSNQISVITKHGQTRKGEDYVDVSLIAGLYMLKTTYIGTESVKINLRLRPEELFRMAAILQQRAREAMDIASEVADA